MLRVRITRTISLQEDITRLMLTDNLFRASKLHSGLRFCPLQPVMNKTVTDGPA